MFGCIGQLISFIDGEGNAIAHGNMLDDEFDPVNIGHNVSEHKKHLVIAGTPRYRPTHTHTLYLPCSQMTPGSLGGGTLSSSRTCARGAVTLACEATRSHAHTQCTHTPCIKLVFDVEGGVFILRIDLTLIELIYR